MIAKKIKFHGKDIVAHVEEELLDYGRISELIFVIEVGKRKVRWIIARRTVRGDRQFIEHTEKHLYAIMLFKLSAPSVIKYLYSGTRGATFDELKRVIKEQHLGVKS